MTKKENTRDELIIRVYELEQNVRQLARQLCELGGVGYNVPILFDKTIMFNSAKYGDVITCPMDDKILTSEKSFMGGNSIEALEAAYERQPD